MEMFSTSSPPGQQPPPPPPPNPLGFHLIISPILNAYPNQRLPPLVLQFPPGTTPGETTDCIINAVCTNLHNFSLDSGTERMRLVSSIHNAPPPGTVGASVERVAGAASGVDGDRDRGSGSNKYAVLLGLQFPQVGDWLVKLVVWRQGVKVAEVEAGLVTVLVKEVWEGLPEMVRTLADYDREFLRSIGVWWSF